MRHIHILCKHCRTFFCAMCNILQSVSTINIEAIVIHVVIIIDIMFYIMLADMDIVYTSH